MFNKFISILNRPFVDKQGGQKGMTLIEIIIVIALIGTLMTIIVRQVTGVSEGAQIDQAKIGMANMSSALQLYRVHMNKYPSTEQGLMALVENPGSKRWRGPYLDKKQLQDPWQMEFQYTSNGRTFEISSAGIDQEFGTAEDLFYPEREGGGEEETE